MNAFGKIWMMSMAVVFHVSPISPLITMDAHGVAPSVSPERARRVARGIAGRCIAGATILVAALGCGRVTPDHAMAYTPRTRGITVTTVPLLVKEEKRVFPFLDPAFAKGGALDGKEVYGFSPSSITVVEGDTIAFTFINPEDDEHSFVLPDFVVALPGNTAVRATYIAKRAGVFTFTCAVATHLPMMWGQLVVLPGATMAAAAGAPSGK